MTKRAVAEPPQILESFDDWAVLSTRVGKCSPQQKAKTLDELGVSSDWFKADTKWGSLIAAGISSGDRRFLERYRLVCKKELERQASGEAEIDLTDLGPAPSVSENDESVAQPVKDFRHRLVLAPDRKSSESEVGAGEEKTTENSRSSVNQEPRVITEKANFVRELVPVGITPIQPIPGQEMTASAQALPLHESLTNSQKALQWTLEKYARFCAELTAEPEERELICANYGIQENLVSLVHSAWKLRFKQNDDLHAQWNKLIAEYSER